MTAKKITLRQRRSGGARLPAEIVADLEKFFAGTQSDAWVLLLPGYKCAQTEIAERWRAWQVDHPSAIPPHVAEWLLEQKK